MFILKDDWTWDWIVAKHGVEIEAYMETKLQGLKFSKTNQQIILEQYLGNKLHHVHWNLSKQIFNVVWNECSIFEIK
jgi:hypothetical protein